MSQFQPLIIGAGVAGLALAVGWQQAHGAAPFLCERAVAPGCQGLGFLLLPRGRRALQALGVDPCKELGGHPIDHARLVTLAGKTIAVHRFHAGTMALELPRLLAVLRQKLDAAKLLVGWPFEGLCHSQGRVEAVRFGGGRQMPADLVFGADGAASRCRRALLDRRNDQWTPGPLARVQEVVALAQDPWLAARLGSGLLKVQDPGGGLAVGLLPLSSDRLVWFVQFDTARYGRPAPGALGSFLERLLVACPAWLQQTIAASDRTARHWQPLDLDPQAKLVGPNLALLGDAAHPMLPFTSQGANLALEDAWILRDLLRDRRDPGEVTAALETYERLRLPLIRHYSLAGRSMAATFVAPGPSLGMLPVAP
jgi:2-polyprenyl-6-methoxyphenol hydroxylase-like FAD-dependent oxidoreductase